MFFPPSGTGHFCLRWCLRQRASVRGEGTGLCYSRRLTGSVRRKQARWHPRPGKRLLGDGKAGFLPSCWGGLSSSGKHHSHLFQRCGSRTDPWLCCLNSRRCMKSHFQSHWIVEGSPIGFHWIFECATHQLVQKEFNGLETLQLHLILCILSSSSRRTAVEESSLPPSQKRKSLIHQHCNRSIILSIQWPLGCQWKKLKNLKSREKPNTVALTLHTLWMSHHCVNQVSKTEQSHNVNASSVLKSMAEFLLILGISIFLDS